MTVSKTHVCPIVMWCLVAFLTLESTLGAHARGFLVSALAYVYTCNQRYSRVFRRDHFDS